MKGHAKNTDRRAVLAAAQAGDEWAFRELVEPYRRSLEVHIYRMLGLAQRNLTSARQVGSQTIDFTGAASRRGGVARAA